MVHERVKRIGVSHFLILYHTLHVGIFLWTTELETEVFELRLNPVEAQSVG